MARIYLSARFERKAELRAVRAALVAQGHEVNCRWLDKEEDVRTDRERTVAAYVCVNNIWGCDVLVAFTEAHRAAERGGRHVELGVAFALQGRRVEFRVILVGPREENIFHHLPGVEQVDTVAALLTLLKETGT